MNNLNNVANDLYTEGNGSKVQTPSTASAVPPKEKEPGVENEKPKKITLTIRERQCLELLAVGKTNQDIAKHFDISVKTVEAHRARVFKKLSAWNAPHAVILAVKHGLIVFDGVNNSVQTERQRCLNIVAGIRHACSANKHACLALDSVLELIEKGSVR